MEGILLKLDEAVKVIATARLDIAEDLSIITAREETLRQGKEGLKIKSEELNAREFEIRKIEDIIAFEQSAKELMVKARAEKEAVNKEARSFDEYMLKERKEISIARQQVDSERAMLKKEYAAIEMIKAELKKKEEEFLTRLIKKITDEQR
jgi:hypothetical protein